MLKSCTKASAREYQTSISSCRLSASLLTTTKAFVVVRARVSSLHFVSPAVGLASHNNKRFSCRPREKQKARTTTKAFVVVCTRVSNLHFVSPAVGLTSHKKKTKDFEAKAAALNLEFI